MRPTHQATRHTHTRRPATHTLIHQTTHTPEKGDRHNVNNTPPCLTENEILKLCNMRQLWPVNIVTALPLLGAHNDCDWTKTSIAATFYCSGLNQGHTECFLVVLNKSTLNKSIHLTHMVMGLKEIRHLYHVRYRVEMHLI